MEEKTNISDLGGGAQEHTAIPRKFYRSPEGGYLIFEILEGGLIERVRGKLILEGGLFLFFYQSISMMMIIIIVITCYTVHKRRYKQFIMKKV